MFVGHFALAAAAKPILKKPSIFSLMLAGQFLDIVFLILFPFKIEYFSLVNTEIHRTFGNLLIHAWYTHSLLGAMLLAGTVYALMRFIFKNDSKTSLGISVLVFSHWILDLVVHRPDMPLLPGNLGQLPLLGMGLWNQPWLVWFIELLMVIAAIGIYIVYQNQNKKQYPPLKLVVTRMALIAFLLLLSAGDLIELLKR
jgi:membrane-bound metal-dependent hydrolase YbcI (DUF457 family)